MLELLLVPAWVRMVAKVDAIELLHPDFKTMAEAAAKGWVFKTLYPFQGQFDSKTYGAVIRFERDETSRMDAASPSKPPRRKGAGFTAGMA